MFESKEEFDAYFESLGPHGEPAVPPRNNPITLEYLDRLQAIYDASTQADAGYCRANQDSGGCPCGILYLKPEVGFLTYLADDVGAIENPKKPGEYLTVVYPPTQSIPMRDVKA